MVLSDFLQSVDKEDYEQYLLDIYADDVHIDAEKFFQLSQDDIRHYLYSVNKEEKVDFLFNRGIISEKLENEKAWFDYYGSNEYYADKFTCELLETLEHKPELSETEQYFLNEINRYSTYTSQRYNAAKDLDKQPAEWPVLDTVSANEKKYLLEAGYEITPTSDHKYQISMPGQPANGKTVGSINSKLRRSTKKILHRIENKLEKNLVAFAADKNIGICHMQELLSEEERNSYSRYIDFDRVFNIKDLNIFTLNSGRIVVCNDENLRQSGEKVEIALPLAEGEINNFKNYMYDVSIKDLKQLIKVRLPENKFVYILYTGHDGFVSSPKILQNMDKTDLDLSRSDALALAQELNEMHWIEIRATSKKLAAQMEEKGYIAEKHGRSGIEARNLYVIKTKEGILTPKVYKKLKTDYENAKQEVLEEKYQTFDAYFSSQSDDINKVYSVVKTGYNYDETRIAKEGKYDVVAEYRYANTQDSRAGMSHTYLALMIDIEAIKKDKRTSITLFVPKEMMGLVIGKGGKSIKDLGQKYGKFFKVKEIPNERYQEKEFDLEEFLRRRKQKATASSTASMPQGNDMAAAIMREKFLGGNGKE